VGGVSFLVRARAPRVPPPPRRSPGTRVRQALPPLAPAPARARAATAPARRRFAPEKHPSLQLTRALPLPPHHHKKQNPHHQKKKSHSPVAALAAAVALRLENRRRCRRRAASADANALADLAPTTPALEYAPDLAPELADALAAGADADDEPAPEPIPELAAAAALAPADPLDAIFWPAPTALDLQINRMVEALEAFYMRYSPFTQAASPFLPAEPLAAAASDDDDDDGATSVRAVKEEDGEALEAGKLAAAPITTLYDDDSEYDYSGECEYSDTESTECESLCFDFSFDANDAASDDAPSPDPLQWHERALLYGCGALPPAQLLMEALLLPAYPAEPKGPSADDVKSAAGSDVAGAAIPPSSPGASSDARIHIELAATAKPQQLCAGADAPPPAHPKPAGRRLRAAKALRCAAGLACVAAAVVAGGGGMLAAGGLARAGATGALAFALRAARRA